MKIPKVSGCSSSWQRCCKHKKRNKKAKEYSLKGSFLRSFLYVFDFLCGLQRNPCIRKGLGKQPLAGNLFSGKGAVIKSLCIRRRDCAAVGWQGRFPLPKGRAMVCSTPRRKYAVTSSPFLLMARPFCSSTGTRGTGRPPVTSGQTGITTCPLRKSRTA